MYEEIRIQGVRRHALEQRLHADAMRQLKTKVDRKTYFEFVWFLCVCILYIVILLDEEGDLDWQYQFFFIEQLITIFIFLSI